MDDGNGATGGSRILVVDDEEVIHASLKRLLGRHGHHVDAVLTGPEALQRIHDETYDLVISDLMMPGMDGIQLMEKLAEMGRSIPVLMITGYPTIRTAMKALRLGAVDYIAKPFTRKELLGPVNRTLRRGAGKVPETPAPAKTPSRAADQTIHAGDLVPGDRYLLPEHSWILYQQDGTVRVGIERSFLDSVDAVASIRLPDESEVLEQGFVGFRLTTASGEEHSVFMPLSGQVAEVNRSAAEDPSSVGPDTWLIRLQPNHLDSELPLLVRG